MKQFLLVMLCVICFVTGYFIHTTDTKTSTLKMIYSIDSIIVDREHYILDSVHTKEKVIITKHDTTIKQIDNLFKNGTDEDKILAFNSYYRPIDTNYLMRITDTQAHAAINEKINHNQDSSLMVIYKNSADDCDLRLQEIKTDISSVKKSYVSDLDSAHTSGLLKGSLITGTTLISLSGIVALYILLTQGR